MRVAVTGTTGRVGAALARHLAENHQVIPLPRGRCDLADPVSLGKSLDALNCEVFINPAAITSLEACEDDPALAMRVNAEAPGEIAGWAARRGVRVIHFSTDYVFGGDEPGLKTEDDIPQPVSVYGRSKLAGENAVLSHSGNLVVRVSWVFGPEKPSFIDQIHDAAIAGRPLAAVADKFSLPLFTGDLAHWTEALLGSGADGIVHACNPGEPVSWHGLAEAVIREMAARGIIGGRPGIAARTLAEMKNFRAARPKHTAMDSGRLAAWLGKPLRPWPEAVAHYVRSRSAGR